MIPNYCDLLQQEEESQHAVSPFSPGPGRDLQDYSLSAVQLQSDERGHGLFPYKILGLESQSVEIDLRPGTLLTICSDSNLLSFQLCSSLFYR